MSKKPLIPFGMIPAYWGTKGRIREIAKAEYELEGHELERKLASVELGLKGPALAMKCLEIEKNYGRIGEEEFDFGIANLSKRGVELELEINELNLKYKKITTEDHEYKLVKLTKEGSELDIDLNYLDFKYHKISEREYEKKRANLLKEPWVNILNVNIDESNPSHGAMELDWNDLFIEKLKASGYIGETDEQMVDSWLMDTCANIAITDMRSLMDQDELQEFDEYRASKKKGNTQER